LYSLGADVSPNRQLLCFSRPRTIYSTSAVKFCIPIAATASTANETSEKPRQAKPIRPFAPLGDKFESF